MIASHSQISNKINSSLSLGKQVASASHSNILTSHIEFAPSDNDHVMSTNLLKAKYRQFGTDNDNNKMLPEVHMNGTKFTNHKMKGPQNGIEDNNRNYVADGIPQPRVQIYNPAKIQLEWKQTHKIGAGLVNVGNTCFMNTVLQCLAYCPPLANYLLHEEDHSAKCKISNFCIMCELQKHFRRAMEHHGQAIKPLSIYQKLRSIAKHFQFGRQEDAHEFLRYVIDHLWKASLANFQSDTKLDPASKETTVINYIFGGYNRSQVICLNCQGRSNTYDHFMDFILDIKNVSSLEGALKKFIEPEMLEDDNAYKCPKCGTKVRAEKKFTVHRSPNVATFQFKRFDYNRMFGGKITKHVSYPEKLDLRPYMSENKGCPIMYRLSSVLVHMGHTCNSGHYYCYVRNSNGFWYVMDDTRVNQVSQNQVLAQQAYVLFYVKVQPPPISKLVIKKPTNLPSNNKLVKNGPIGPSVDSRQSLSHSPYLNHHHSCISNVTPNSLPNGKSAINPNGNSPRPITFTNNHHVKRDKITFDIKRSLLTSSGKTNGSAGNHNLNHVYQAELGVLVKDRPKNVANNATVANRGSTKTLVPYTEDSSETDEEKPLPANKMVNGHCSLKKEGPNLKLSEIPLPGEKDREKPHASLPHDNPTRVLFDQPSRVDKSASKLTLPLGNRACEGARVKATFTWNVLEERNHSPSITSNSSNCSVNSTTDWNVKEQDNPASKKERGCVGWSIKAKENGVSVASAMMNDKEKTILDPCVPTSSKASRVLSADSDKTVPIKSSESQPALNDSGHRERGVVSSEVDRLGLPRNSFPGRGEPDRCERQLPDREPRGGGDRTSPSSVPNAPGGKTNKPPATKSADDDPGFLNRKRWWHDSDRGDEKGDFSLFKKHKTGGGESTRESGPDAPNQTDKSQFNGGGRLNITGDCNGERRKKKSHRKKHSDDETSESSYEWIEKTKETVEAEKTKFSSSAPCKVWDSGLKDGYRRNAEPTPNASMNGGTHWDGVRKNDVISELLELSGKGYNSNVNTWDESQSTLERDEDKYRKRMYADDYDDEFDKGKVKKIKKRYSDTDLKPTKNPFQQYQEFKRDRPNGFNDRYVWERNSQNNVASYNDGNHYSNNRYSLNKGNGGNRYRYHNHSYQNHRVNHRYHNNPNYSR